MSMSGELRRALAEAAAVVEAALDHCLSPQGHSGQQELCRYSLLSGGKRLRPFLALSSCRAVSGKHEAAVPAACAVEMIHTYSLIHDDLPSMDNDDIRRGKPTLHMVFGTENALFAGDRLILEAFGKLLETPVSEHLLLMMVRKLAIASGPGFLVGGQFMDMYPPADATQDWTTRMIMGKTAAMIRVSMELGALAASAESGLVRRVSRIGDRIGWLFQLTDDILDVTGSIQEMGKAVMKDAGMGKLNPVSILGTGRAKKVAFETAEEISAQLDTLPGDWDIVRHLVRHLPERRN